MSLVRVQTVWSGVAGAPYYTNTYCIGPSSTNNGNDMAAAWRAFLQALTTVLTTGLVATIDPELLEFNESDGVVTGAGTTTQAPVTFGGTGDQLPHSNQALVQWSTNGIVHNRRVRGRTFIPGILESGSSATGTPLASVGTPLQSAIDTYLSTMSGRGRIWSRPVTAEQATPSVPARPGSAHTITAGKVAPYFAILRSRRD